MNPLFFLVMFASVASSLAALSTADQQRYLQGVKAELSGLRGELTHAAEANERLQVDLFATKAALITSCEKNESALSVQNAALGQVVQLQTDLGIADAAYGKLISDNAQLQKEKSAEHTRYLRAKFFIGGIAGLVAGVLTLLLLLRFGALALDSIAGLAAVCGVPLIVSGAVFGAMQLLF